MKVVILAGGKGTRLSEETETIPKPMLEVGGKPMLWHIMKAYSHYGFNDFVLCLGYKGYIIKEYFSHYFLHTSDVMIDIGKNTIKTLFSESEPWKITMVDTGVDTMTGGRLKRIEKYVKDEPFMMTYGDGVSDIDIKKLVEFHKKGGKMATVTAVQPLGRFGSLEIDKNRVTSFLEKPKGDNGWINGGFFVLEPGIFKYIKGDQAIWEQEPMRNIAKDDKLIAYKHTGFWKPMDTLRDKRELEELWSGGRAPWKVWR
ncbi:MAG: glucose-1-phosphate cytidylyltransferase [Endomicrobiales bacterium]|nr:glucose-1-phosphate cytidylyltransferase [Endomicrobiales bacterium]